MSPFTARYHIAVIRGLLCERQAVSFSYCNELVSKAPQRSEQIFIMEMTVSVNSTPGTRKLANVGSCRDSMGIPSVRQYTVPEADIFQT
jgi:hypothetical protein